MPRLADVAFEEIKYETEKAILFVIDGREIWLPKSLCEVDRHDKVVSLPENLAIEKEIV